MNLLEVFGQIVVLLLSLGVLMISAKYVVEKAIRLAKFFRISEFAIGFIFVSVLTSIPELSVAVVSSVNGNNNLSLGDLLGSNVTNIALILGLCGFLGSRYKFRKDETNHMLLFLVLSLIPLILILDGQLNYTDGIIFLILFVAFVYYVSSKKVTVNETEGITKVEASKDFIIFVAGIGGVIISAGFVVESAVKIATMLGIFQSFLGATIIALGTSLPELAVNVVATSKRRTHLALGNILGSCVTNLTLILGINVILNPFIPNMEMVGPLILFVVISTIVLGYVLWKRKEIRKEDGLILLGIYLLYLIIISGVQVVKLSL
ncbi:MAG: sodium:calcium antiporter [Candidatus Micrarchaeia archaeon]